MDSAISRAAHDTLYTHAGPEVSVASTKCFTSQLAALLLLAYYMVWRRETFHSGAAGDLFRALRLEQSNK